jgi:hypothetical protein
VAFHTEETLNRKTAGTLILAVALLLAVLLLLEIISPVVSAVIFAVCLISLGILSGGFRK